MYEDPNSPYKHFGLEVGIVTNDIDPSGSGRVFVTVPGVIEGVWAEVVSLGSPCARGDKGTPVVNGQVLVGFKQGDLDSPVVLGGIEPPVLAGGMRASIPENQRQKFRFIENEDWVFVLGASGTPFPYAAIMSRDDVNRVAVIMDLEAHTIKVKAPMGIHITTDGVLKLDGGTSVQINGRVVTRNGQPI